jgi:hypothetical protein
LGETNNVIANTVSGGSTVVITSQNPTTEWTVTGSVLLTGKPTWGKTLESGLIVAVPAQRIAYVRVSATSEYVSVAGTTSYKTQILNSVTGDSIGASVASNRLTIPAGKYAFVVPVGSYGNAGWMSLQVYNAGTSSQIVELTGLIYNTTVDSIPFRDAHFTLALTGVTTMEFRTKCSGGASGDEYLGTIKITKLE